MAAIDELNSNSYLFRGGTAIPNNSDMDDYKEIGNYYCSANSIASTLINSPFTRAFTMKVEFSQGTSYPCQICKLYDTGMIARRYYDVSKWSGWSYFSDDATVSLYQTVISTNDVLQSAESQQSNQAKFYYLGGSNYTGDIPSGGSYGYGTAIALKRGSSSIFVVIFSIGKPIYNAYNNSRWEGWKYFDGTSAQ